jgi:hypothetical protein
LKEGRAESLSAANPVNCPVQAELSPLGVDWGETR